MTREELIAGLAGVIGDAMGECDDYYDREAAEAALTFIEQSGFMIVEGWRPISEAKKDTTPILGYNGEHMFVMDWLGTEWQLTHSGTYADDGDVWPDPTHYMPLPSPPKSTDDSKEADA